MTRIFINGDPAEVSDGATVDDVLERLDLPPERRGVAVAVDAQVVPRGEWPRHVVRDGARVEVLTAIQGG